MFIRRVAVVKSKTTTMPSGNHPPCAVEGAGWWRWTRGVPGSQHYPGVSYGWHRQSLRSLRYGLSGGCLLVASPCGSEKYYRAHSTLSIETHSNETNRVGEEPIPQCQRYKHEGQNSEHRQQCHSRIARPGKNNALLACIDGCDNEYHRAEDKKKRYRQNFQGELDELNCIPHYAWSDPSHNSQSVPCRARVA